MLIVVCYVFERGVITKQLKTGSRETEYYPSALNVPVGVSISTKKLQGERKILK